MASNDIALALTRIHREAQVQIGLDVVTQLSAVWPILDPSRIDQTTADWLEVALEVIRGQRQASAELAATYMEVFRQLELGEVSSWTATMGLPAELQMLTTSLRVTGPYRLKERMAAGDPLSVAVDKAEVASSAAAVRHALNGGRDTIWTSGNADPNVVGYARVTSGNPCAFCAMLAGRGAAYRSEESASFQPHDGCACFPEPIFKGSEDSTGVFNSDGYKQLYDDSTQGKSGRDAINSFRRAYDAQLTQSP